MQQVSKCHAGIVTKSTSKDSNEPRHAYSLTRALVVHIHKTGTFENSVDPDDSLLFFYLQHISSSYHIHYLTQCSLVLLPPTYQL